MEYLDALDTQNTLPPAEITAVDRREAMFETMMLGLRMTGGVSERDFERMHGAALSQVYGPALERLAGEGLGAWSSGAPGEEAVLPHPTRAGGTKRGAYGADARKQKGPPHPDGCGRTHDRNLLEGILG